MSTLFNLIIAYVFLVSIFDFQPYQMALKHKVHGCYLVNQTPMFGWCVV
jgi:hypothetical protein